MQNINKVEGTAFSGDLEAMRTGLTPLEIGRDTIADMARSPNPSASLETFLGQVLDGQFGGMRDQAKTIYQRLKETRDNLNQQRRRSAAKATKTERARIHYERKPNGEVKPTLIEHLQVLGIETIAIIALVGALVTVASAFRTVNPSLYAEPEWKLLLMATPLLLSGKLGFTMTLAHLDPTAIRRLATGFGLVAALAFLVWVTAFSVEVSMATSGGTASSGDFTYAAAGTVDFTGGVTTLRFWAQLVAEVVGSCAVSASARIFALRGRKLVAYLSEESAMWSERVADADEQIDQVVRDIAACEGVLGLIEAECQRVKEDARAKLAVLIERSNHAAAEARRKALDDLPRQGRERQLRVV